VASEVSHNRTDQTDDREFLFRATKPGITSRHIHVADKPVLVKFFGISQCVGECGTITEILYDAGEMPQGFGSCCMDCIPEGIKLKRLGEQPIMCPDKCEPLCINWCNNQLLFVTPGVYKITIPKEWMGSVTAKVTETALEKLPRAILI